MNVLHIAPHLDDETIGCGGALLAHIHAGDAVHWLVVTETAAAPGGEVDDPVSAVSRAYGFAGTHRLGLPDMRLDALPMAEIVDAIGAVVKQAEPAVIYVPHPADVHSDHRIVFDAAMPCTKWFRFPCVRRVLAYETLSESNFGLDPTASVFRPNVYRNISAHLERKLAILRACAPAEVGDHPFPRSEAAIRALAVMRGSEAGCSAAEAFMLLRDIS